MSPTQPVNLLGRVAHAANIMESAGLGTVTVADLRQAHAAMVLVVEKAKALIDAIDLAPARPAISRHTNHLNAAIAGLGADV